MLVVVIVIIMFIVIIMLIVGMGIKTAAFAEFYFGQTMRIRQGD